MEDLAKSILELVNDDADAGIVVKSKHVRLYEDVEGDDDLSVTREVLYDPVSKRASLVQVSSCHGFSDRQTLLVLSNFALAVDLLYRWERSSPLSLLTSSSRIHIADFQPSEQKRLCKVVEKMLLC